MTGRDALQPHGVLRTAQTGQHDKFIERSQEAEVDTSFSSLQVVELPVR